jgi:hypothetical protein
MKQFDKNIQNMEKDRNHQTRRKFIQQISLASALLLTGRITDLSAEEVYNLKARLS